MIEHYDVHLDNLRDASRRALEAVIAFLEERGYAELLEETYISAVNSDGQDWDVEVGVSNILDISVNVPENADGRIVNRALLEQRLPIRKVKVELTRQELAWIWNAVMGERQVGGVAPDRFVIEAAINELEDKS